MRVLAVLSLIFMFTIAPAHAWESENFAEALPDMLGIKTNMVKIVRGTVDATKFKILCGIAQKDAYWMRVERGRLDHNHIINEIPSDEQKRDIEALAEKLGPYSDCKRNMQLWNAYDDKWYAAKRNRKHQDFLNRQQAAVDRVADTGDDVWDGVIGTTVFAIPRQYMWFGSHKQDGLDTGINLRF